MIKNSYFKQSITWFFMCLALMLASGCSGFYTFYERDYNSSGELKTSELEEFRNALLFIHFNDNVVQIQSPVFSDENQTITGEIIPLNKEAYSIYLQAKKNGSPTKKKSTNTKIKQIHFFVSEYSELENNKGNNLLIFSKKNVIETVLLKDIKGSAATGTFFIALVSIAGTVFIGYFIILYILCNCPHVYTANGNTYNKKANAFVGALSQQLEYTDYVMTTPYNQLINMVVVNAVEGEKQYINHSQLIEINHSNKVYVLNDQQGDFYSVSKGTDNISSTVPELAERNDQLSMQFNTLSENDLSEKIIRFPNKSKDGKARMVLSLKNTRWSSYVYKEWAALFGDKADKNKEKMSKRTKEELLNWRKEQGVMLSVYIKVDGKWQYQQSVDVVGSTMYKDLVVPLDNINTTEKELEVKLVTGYNLWEIDYASMDYSEQENLTITKKEISSWAVNSKNKVDSTLSDIDEDYLLLEYGDTLALNYNDIKTLAENTTTYAVSLTGYYITENKNENKMKIREVMSFKHPAQMSRYSHYLMSQLTNDLTKNE